MSKDGLDALSAAHRETVRSALVAAFGSAPIDAITPIAGGASTALTFRVDAGDRRYLLRVEGQPSPLRNPHQYDSMRIAAEAGLAPRIHYLDASDRVVMMEFVEDRGLENFPGGPSGLAQASGALLKQLQGLPLFS